ncbi:MAG: glycosyltransferase [Wenzhouxiangella sp.]
MTQDSLTVPVQFVVLPDHSGQRCTEWIQRLSRAGDPPLARWQPSGTAADQRGELFAFLSTLDPKVPILVVRSGLTLPPDWAARLGAELAEAEHEQAPLPRLPAGNYADAVNPVAGLSLTLTAEQLADWLWLAAEHHAAPVDDYPTDCLFLPPGAAQAWTPVSPALLLDSLFVHDPERPLTAGNLLPPAARAALGPIRLRLQRLLAEDLSVDPPRPGRDKRPVTLHISHDWGGGIPRWIGDLIAADPAGHHLVLAASGDPDGTVHGQALRLYAGGPGSGLVQEWTLTPAIADTVVSAPRYRSLLTRVIDRYGVGRILVSSLIGHSLDALNTGVPTAQILHDHYPLWPLLDRDPLDWRGADGRIDLAGALARHGSGRLFQPRASAHWQGIRDAWLDHVRRHDILLIAPSFGVLERWRALSEDKLSQAQVIGHGFSGWAVEPEPIAPRARADGRLNVVVVGRLSSGKGLELLEEALDRLQPLAHLTLLGCGRDGLRFLGRPHVDLIFNYQREALPALLANVRPQAALFLSTVPETWNYTLSEIRSLGIPPLATRLGSFLERIDAGRDGWLFAPEVDALVALISALKAEPQRLSGLQGSRPETPCSLVAQRYWHLVPAAAAPAAALSLASVQTLAAGALQAELAEREQRLSQLQDQYQRLEQDLAERADWATRYERLSEQRTRWARSLEQEIERERAATGQILAQLDDSQNRLQKTQELLERSDQALAETGLQLHQVQVDLDTTQAELGRTSADLQTVLNSRSWRWTRPLRFAIRALRQAKHRGAWNPLRWPRLVSRLVHSLRLHGLKTTLQLAQGSSLETHERPALPTAATPVEREHYEPVLLPAHTQPRASIIIPVYNKLAYTAACLQSIADEAGELPFEVIVVDDCSTDTTPEFLASCTGIKSLRNGENSGFIASCNAGAAAACGDYLVFLNNDTTVTPGWLDALLQTFEDFRGVGIAGARLVYPDGTLQESGGIIFNDASGWNYGRNQSPDAPQYNFAAEADYVSGACLAIPRALFEALDGFDRHYAPAYYEDTDLCFRVRERGLRVFCQPACTIIHHEGVSSGTDESSGTKRYQAVNREKFLARWAEALALQPPHRTDDDRADPVRRARFHRARGRALLIDATTPMPDHDSGSVRFTAMLELMVEAGWQVSFMPQNLNWEGPYSEGLQRRGVEVLCAPGVRSPEAWLNEHGEDLDLVLVSRHYVLEPLIKTIRQRCPHARLIFDTVDLHFLRERRQADLSGSESMAAAAERTRRTELKLMRDSDVTLVVSPVEQSLLAEWVPEAEVRVLSNIHSVRGRQRDWRERRDLMFVGGFQHPPNVDAAEWLIDEIFPLIRAELPDVRLHLIGSRMPEALRSKAADGVLVHGYVEDLSPYLNGCRLSLAPLRYGAGVKGKVNQAMAWGLPVVASSCAAEGMFLVDGQDVLTADDSISFARQVVRAYADERLWLQLSDAGMANVARYFSRSAAGEVIAELLKRAEREPS